MVFYLSVFLLDSIHTINPMHFLIIFFYFHVVTLPSPPHKQQKVYEAIATLQNGANLGFRYEISPMDTGLCALMTGIEILTYRIGWEGYQG